MVWLQAAGVNTVFSLLPGNQNQAAYEAAGMHYVNCPVTDDLEPEDAPLVSTPPSTTPCPARVPVSWSIATTSTTPSTGCSAATWCTAG